MLHSCTPTPSTKRSYFTFGLTFCEIINGRPSKYYVVQNTGPPIPASKPGRQHVRLYGGLRLGKTAHRDASAPGYTYSPGVALVSFVRRAPQERRRRKTHSPPRLRASSCCQVSLMAFLPSSAPGVSAGASLRTYRVISCAKQKKNSRTDSSR